MSITEKHANEETTTTIIANVNNDNFKKQKDILSAAKENENKLVEEAKEEERKEHAVSENVKTESAKCQMRTEREQDGATVAGTAASITIATAAICDAMQVQQNVPVLNETATTVAATLTGMEMLAAALMPTTLAVTTATAAATPISPVEQQHHQQQQKTIGSMDTVQPQLGDATIAFAIVSNKSTMPSAIDDDLCSVSQILNSKSNNNTTTITSIPAAPVALLPERLAVNENIEKDVLLPTSAKDANEHIVVTSNSQMQLLTTTAAKDTSSATITTTTSTLAATKISTTLSYPSPLCQPLIPSGVAPAPLPLPPLPPPLSHTASDPTFGVELRRDQQQRKIKSYHDAKQSAVSSSSSCLNAIIKFGGGGAISASVSPSMIRKSSDGAATIPRRVSFPKSDKELVTGYLEPANPWEHVDSVKNVSEITELYKTSCKKHNTQPLPTIIDHLNSIDLNKQTRQPSLMLKSTKLTHSACEALEEIFKRVQYKVIDVSSCELEENAASALFEMIEFYEATNELDISSNADGMTLRGWTSCAYMVGHSQALQLLNAQGNPISKTSVEHLGREICTSNLHTLKLEHCGLKGVPLDALCFRLEKNHALKELWLAYNDLDINDAQSLAGLLKNNHYLELLDISNNNIKDDGVWALVEALITQSTQLECRSMLQRAVAIDDDSSFSIDDPTSDSIGAACAGGSNTSAIEIVVGVCGKIDNAEISATIKKETASVVVEPLVAVLSCASEVNQRGLEKEFENTQFLMNAMTTATTTTGVATTTPLPITEENDGDEDTEDTIVNSSIFKPAMQSAGQSMLDKLLSMNSDSTSSEEGASNLSTDTVAACCSEDTSIISDDIFDNVMNNKTTSLVAVSTVGVGVGAGTGTLVAPVAAAPVAYMDAVMALGSGNVLEETIEKNAVDSNICDLLYVSEALSSGDGYGDGDGDNSTCNSNSDISNSTNTTTSQNNNACSISNNNINNNNNNNLNNNKKQEQHLENNQTNIKPIVLPTDTIYEVTAEESDCLIPTSVVDGGGEGAAVACGESLLMQQSVSRALDVNKNTKLAEEYDDTHSTDSAFESASEGDISRHLPEEFSRLSASFDSTRLDDLTKEVPIETATIATESTESLVEAAATPTCTPTPSTQPLAKLLAANTSTVESQEPTQLVLSNTAPHLENIKTNSLLKDSPQPKVTIAADSLSASKHKEDSFQSPNPTPPPPSTSPGCASVCLRRNDSSSACNTPPGHNRSQSTDSLCSSDNSLDGSISSGSCNFSTSTQINEKLTKNDTLTRQQRQQETVLQPAARAPNGLKALALWNNNLTRDSGQHIAALLAQTCSLELLNIGKNCLSNDFVSVIKDSLIKNTTVTTLGLQSAHLSAKGIETLASILTFGGNSTLQRIDIRGNKIEVESLSTLTDALKSNSTVTQIDIDDEPKRLSFEKLRIVPFVSITPCPNIAATATLQDNVGSDAHMDYARVLENVRSMCSRNEKTQAQVQADKAANVGAAANRRRGGYYVGSRKISLTCHSRPLIEPTVVTAVPPPPVVNKLDVKHKTGGRLRSPVPSPPTVSPSSSPSRSRFHVKRVFEDSPLTSPLAQTPPTHSPSPSSYGVGGMNIPAVSIGGASYTCYKASSTSLPTSSSLPSMATVTSSTQSIKRLSVSPRSRFHVSKIYEDPGVPLAHRCLPPITPPINLPPTPIHKHAPESDLKTVQMASGYEESTEASVAATAITIASNKQQMPNNVSKTNTTTLTMEAVTATSTSEIEIENENEKSTNTEASLAAAIQTITTKTKTTTTLITPAPIPVEIPTTPPIITTAIVATAPTTIAPNPTSANAQSNNQVSCTSLSPLSSSSSSSSSSTSPASLSSSSSSTASASSATSSFTPLGSSSSGSSLDHIDHILPALPHLPTKELCPIAVFSENDITLTKNSGQAVCSVSTGYVGEEPSQPVQQQQRARKLSWRPNTGLDKLLTLFQPTIFQRSASPEATQVSGAAMQGNNLQDSTSNSASGAVLPLQQQQNALVPSRKNSSSSWTKLGTELLSVGGGSVGGVGSSAASNETRNTVAATAAAMSEQSRSFVDAASRQLRDLVFRQNLSFGSETNMPVNLTSNTTAATATTAVATDSVISGNVGNTVSNVSPEHDAAFIPKDVKQEIKENISPEHTINEETLNSLQLLSCQGASAAALGLGVVEDVSIQTLPIDMKNLTDATSLQPDAAATGGTLLIEDSNTCTKASDTTTTT